MIASPQPAPDTPEEYLQREGYSLIKHEYIDGNVYAIAGAADGHVTTALNLATLIRPQIRGSGCRISMSDMTVQIKPLQRFYYPDVLVTGDARDQATSNDKQFPCLIVEVLSDSTEAFERGDKFADYQLLDRLQEYVLINTRWQRVECLRRNDGNLWTLQSYTDAQVIFQLKSIAFEGQIANLYEDVTFSSP